MAFTHLHVHTENSLLDGAARIKTLVASAKKKGMNSLAITDHGVMFGVIDFYKECKKQGIKPIIGCEVYIARRSRLDKEAGIDDKKRYHLILLAKNEVGYKNLMKIVSTGFVEGFYRKPRVDKEILRQYSEGIVALSACLFGEVPDALLYHSYERAKEIVNEYIDIFGKENYFLEIQNQGLEEEIQIMPLMKKLSDETSIPLVATNDVHYVEREDAELHDILLCLQTNNVASNPNRMKFANDEFYLKSEDEMRKVFVNIPEAIDNTQIVADMCNVEFEFGKLHLPEFKPPKNLTVKEYLQQLCIEGINRVYPTITDEIRERLDYELSVIESMGYIEYFLIVWDFINFAKKNDIPVGPGRGSAAGSIVSYALGITGVDPIKYGLIFERFLNPERVSMPDIDIDFCYERRQEVIDYVIAKYGKDKVSQIITFGTMKARGAIRDVGRVLELSYGETDKLAKMVPNELKMTINKALDINPSFNEACNENLLCKKVVDMAIKLEGINRHASTHAAGVVISKNPIDEYVPLYSVEGQITTQFPMTTIEELGLLKMDFLGLKNLTTIQDAIDLIKNNHGIEIDFTKMNFDDSKVYDLISSGDTEGLFQLASPGMTQFMKQLKPDCFEDIIAGISLYRPGPMDSIPTYIENKKNPNNISYLSKELEPILSVTYGCLVYQEQVMQIVRELAGYTYGHSDVLRRAMGKKKMDVMVAERSKFEEGCLDKGISKEVASQIFDQMVKFAEYAFNKSHAAAYAVLAYQTAYLKTHYPIEFMTALMSTDINDPIKVAKYIRNCKKLNIDILPVDINYSMKKFSIENGQIRIGMLLVKGAGEASIDEIIKNREENGKYTDLVSFVNRQNLKNINKKTIESLIKVGALDSIDSNRAKTLSHCEMIYESVQKDTRKKAPGQISLFDLANDEIDDVEITLDLPDVADFTLKTKTQLEKEGLGLYISAHPLDPYEKLIERKTSANSEILEIAASDIENNRKTNISDRDSVVVAGNIVNVKQLTTKRGQMMAFVDIEDYTGIVEVVVFPDTYKNTFSIVKEDNPVIIRGTVTFEEGKAATVLAQNIALLDDLVKNKDNNSEKYLILKLEENLTENVINDKINTLIEIFKSNSGNTPIYIFAMGRKLKIDKRFWVDINEDLLDELKLHVNANDIMIKTKN
ncbi:MAG: DNA polymerase III subunit alpha [Eubacteriales bacterium]|nr:DNA polymerase III subunit alpha [Eubacteriales bacterium]MDY3332931.1 DNA polymerase III subunit alpha [Gallibacter sp.]